MKQIQNMVEALNQRHSVITFDLANYIKAKEIHWCLPEEFNNTILMGGFHFALNFLLVIGKRFQDSSLEDLLMESGMYGGNITNAGHFANVSMRQQPVHQRTRSIRQRLRSVRQRPK